MKQKYIRTILLHFICLLSATLIIKGLLLLNSLIITFLLMRLENNFIFFSMYGVIMFFLLPSLTILTIPLTVLLLKKKLPDSMSVFQLIFYSVFGFVLLWFINQLGMVGTTNIPFTLFIGFLLVGLGLLFLSLLKKFYY